MGVRVMGKRCADCNGNKFCIIDDTTEKCVSCGKARKREITKYSRFQHGTVVYHDGGVNEDVRDILDAIRAKSIKGNSE